MYAGVPYPNAEDKALSMAASNAMTSELPNRFRTFWKSKASRLVMHFCNRSIRRRFCPAVRIEARRMMFEIASDYDKLASRADQRMAKQQSK
jgi:hypothetical protein